MVSKITGMLLSKIYGNLAEDVIKNENDYFIRESSVKNKKPKVISRYINPKVEEIKKRKNWNTNESNIDDNIKINIYRNLLIRLAEKIHVMQNKQRITSSNSKN